MIFCRSSVRVFVRWIVVEDRDDFGSDPLWRKEFEGEDPLMDEAVEYRRRARGDLLLFLIALGTGGGLLKALGLCERPVGELWSGDWALGIRKAEGSVEVRLV